ncbi:uncharacterized protein LOC133844881 [Drosophila sulfurigaster albostrigata]|uniref:uncharacterized protein LOC133844881 n=1 Tax=Drosophila sulfurigaster albostrigata TaxID=89887 RepID=UPI002D218529|nr:uncharacterized protein LOC133844881 [Drosophila sulfurigaster albostrigata]
MLHLELLLLLVLGIVVLRCQADCNTCASPSNIACVSDTQFQFCSDNVLIEPVNNCPDGTYCTAESAICQSDIALKACTGCAQCNDQLSFACLGVRTFALCLGTNTPSNITGSCTANYVCNRDNPNICSSAALGSTATCPLADDDLQTTVYPNVVVTPNEYCRNVQRAGRFPYGNTLDTTCHQYILCFQSNSVWYGGLYNCPGSTYFQATIQSCNTTVPSYCTSAVRSLQVRNLLLL